MALEQVVADRENRSVPLLELATLPCLLFGGLAVVAIALKNPTATDLARAATTATMTDQPLDDAVTRGTAAAPVGIIEYADFQCPFCGQFARATLPDLEHVYIDTGRAVLVFRHLPLAIHRHSRQAATAAACAGRDGAFWQMHDLLFRNQDRLDEEALRDYARQAGVDSHGFDVCQQGHDTDNISRDAEAAAALGIYGTPTFLIGPTVGGRAIRVTDIVAGVHSTGDFHHILDRLLAARDAKGGVTNPFGS